MELHQGQLKGFTPEQGENYFLRIASQLDTYAVDPHPVKVIFPFLLHALLATVLKSFESSFLAIHFHFNLLIDLPENR